MSSTSDKVIDTLTYCHGDCLKYTEHFYIKRKWLKCKVCGNEIGVKTLSQRDALYGEYPAD